MSMSEDERREIGEVISELETDVRLARTREEHMRLTRRVNRLKALVMRGSPVAEVLGG